MSILCYFHVISYASGDFPPEKKKNIALEKCCKMQARVASFIAEAIAPSGHKEDTWRMFD